MLSSVFGFPGIENIEDALNAAKAIPGLDVPQYLGMKYMGKIIDGNPSVMVKFKGPDIGPLKNYAMEYFKVYAPNSDPEVKARLHLQIP